MTNIYDLSGAIAHDIAGTGSERGPRPDHRRSDGKRRGEPGREPSPDGLAPRGQRRGEGPHEAPGGREPRRAAPLDDRIRRGVRESCARSAGTCTSGRTTPGSSPATRTCGRRSRNTPRAPRSPRSTPRCSGGCWRSSSRAGRSPIRKSSRCRRSRTSRRSGGRAPARPQPRQEDPARRRGAPLQVGRREEQLLRRHRRRQRSRQAGGQGPAHLGGREGQGRGRRRQVAERRRTERGSRAGRVRVQCDADRLFNRIYYPGRHPKDGDGPAVGRLEDDAHEGEGRQVQHDRRRERDRGGAGLHRRLEAL